MADDVRLISELTVSEFKMEARAIMLDIPPDHFLKAAEIMMIQHTQSIGKELTGKDIMVNSDVLCIRKTFDDSQENRLKKEKIKDAVLTEGAKKITQWVGLALAIALGLCNY